MKKLVARYNKDGSVTLYCRGRKVFRTKGDIAPFCEGFFSTEDRTLWHLRYAFK